MKKSLSTRAFRSWSGLDAATEDAVRLSPEWARAKNLKTKALSEAPCAVFENHEATR